MMMMIKKEIIEQKKEKKKGKETWIETTNTQIKTVSTIHQQLKTHKLILTLHINLIEKDY